VRGSTVEAADSQDWIWRQLVTKIHEHGTATIQRSILTSSQTERSQNKSDNYTISQFSHVLSSAAHTQNLFLSLLVYLHVPAMPLPPAQSMSILFP